MSLFKSLKGTLKEVQDDFSEGLKALKPTSPDKQSQPDLRHQQHSDGINVDAGGSLLHKHELIWKDLYQYTEETAKKAQDLDVDIGSLFIYYDKQSEILTRLHDQAATLPMLLTQLQDITDSLAHVEEEYDKVECALVRLEDICEEQELQRNITAHHKQLAVYKMKKEHELQKYKVKLARDHAHKMEQVNKKREHLLHERQTAFEEQFTQDVDFFKKHGKPGRLPSTPESEKKLDLADVDIEEDPSALDAFLESSTSDLTLSETKNDIPVQGDDDEGPTTEILTEITSPSVSDITSPSVSETDITSPDTVDNNQSTGDHSNTKLTEDQSEIMSTTTTTTTEKDDNVTGDNHVDSQNVKVDATEEKDK